MSIDNLQMQYALRTQLLTMEAATTGSISIEATTTMFVRTSGSFITDGFEPGMELAATGFSVGANNDNWTVDTVTALTLGVAGLTADGAAVGRTLTVALPAGRAWENIKFDPVADQPWAEEEYLSGPSSQVTGGTGAATLDVGPLYIVRIYVPENRGVGAVNRYSDAVLTTFKSNTSMTLTNTDVLKVRVNPGPFRSTISRERPGWVVVPINVACQLLTLNS